MIDLKCLRYMYTGFIVCSPCYVIYCFPSASYIKCMPIKCHGIVYCTYSYVLHAIYDRLFRDLIEYFGYSLLLLENHTEMHIGYTHIGHVYDMHFLARFPMFCALLNVFIMSFFTRVRDGFISDLVSEWGVCFGVREILILVISTYSYWSSLHTHIGHVYILILVISTYSYWSFLHTHIGHVYILILVISTYSYWSCLYTHISILINFGNHKY